MVEEEKTYLKIQGHRPRVHWAGVEGPGGMVTEKMQRSVVTEMVDVIKEICIYCFINNYILLS